MQRLTNLQREKKEEFRIRKEIQGGREEEGDGGGGRRGREVVPGFSLWGVGGRPGLRTLSLRGSWSS